MRNDSLTVLWERYIALLHSGDPGTRDAYWEWREAGGEPNCVYVVKERLPSVEQMLSLRRPGKFFP